MTQIQFVKMKFNRPPDVYLMAVIVNKRSCNVPSVHFTFKFTVTILLKGLKWIPFTFTLTLISYSSSLYRRKLHMYVSIIA